MGDNDALMGLPDEPVIESDEKVVAEGDEEFVFAPDEANQPQPKADDEPASTDDDDEKTGLIPDVDAIRELHLQQVKDERDHWRTAHEAMTGKNGTQIGNLKDRNTQLEAEVTALRQAGTEGYTPPAPGAPGPNPAHDPRVDALTEELEARRKIDAEGTYSQTVNEFGGKFPDLDESLIAGIKQHMTVNAERIRSVVNSADPTSVRMVTNQLLTEGLMQAMHTRRTENMARQKTQTEKVTSQKTLATPPQSKKTRTTPRGPITDADIAKMPPDQQQRALEAYFRSIGRRGF